MILASNQEKMTQIFVYCQGKHDFYNNNNNRFVQAIADLSLNELNVHFLGSTKIVLDNPYAKLRKVILNCTKYSIKKQ